IDEGADMVLVKPGIFYLDVLSSISNTFDIPVLTYQVSGEYSMLKAAALQGWLDYEECMYEALLSMKRAGARNIITYAALEVARKLCGTGGV
ncbi:MAG: porphobilinogen synthase, partial [Anaplasma sp.]|nr:porphobilinogen synthase [Anaplasma sp.]